MSQTNFPPGPKTGPLGLDFMNKFKSDPLKTAVDLRTEYGDFVHVKAGPYHWFMFNHPDQVKDVFVTRSRIFGKTDIFKRVLSSVDGNGLVVSEGDFWLKQRRTINPAFSHASVSGYATTMLDETQKYIARWEPGTTIDLASEMTKLTLTIAARSFFNVDVSKNAQELGDAVTTVSRALLQEFLEIMPVPDWLPLPSKIAKRKAVATIDSLIQESIAAHQKDPDSHHDVLSMLLKARDTEGDGEGMSLKQVRDEAITLFNAGHDSTAAALSWCWYLLLKHPRVYDKLLAASEEDASQLATQVAKEAMRLYPPAWTLPRQSLEDTEIADFTVPAGSLLNFFPYVLQRDERFFDDPEEFMPERFSPENEHKMHPFAFFPFGAGPRACIGKEMALTEMSVVLTAVSKKFRLELLPGQPEVEPLPLISLEQKTGVKAIVRSR